MNEEKLRVFQDTVLAYYREYGRHALPWRQNIHPYRVLVSELMLQQTQVGRVIPKFHQLLTAFPTVESLAHAPLADVLAIWLGLGYNRRARYLHMAAQKISEDFGGIVPHNQKSLESLPGIGPNTAGAILTYAYNKPALFIETNVRSVYIHHFFPSQSVIDDQEIRALLEQTIDHTNPRVWYWALMDYGTYLKATAGNNIQRSRHYVKQSKFAGSQRQLRGTVLRELSVRPLTQTALLIKLADERLESVLEALQSEGLIERSTDELFRLTGGRELP